MIPDDPLIQAIEQMTADMVTEHEYLLAQLTELDQALFRADADVMRKIETVRGGWESRRRDIMQALIAFAERVNGAPQVVPPLPPMQHRVANGRGVLQ